MVAIVRGDRVSILVGDEAGSWGIVRLVQGSEYHVAISGSLSDVRTFQRSEIRRRDIFAWQQYDVCPKCDQTPGNPCFDLRYGHDNHHHRHHPHPERPRRGTQTRLEQYEEMGRLAKEALIKVELIMSLAFPLTSGESIEDTPWQTATEIVTHLGRLRREIADKLRD